MKDFSTSPYDEYFAMNDDKSETLKPIKAINFARVTRSRGPYLIAFFESYAHIPSTVLK